jgi:hypothetical protein
MQEGSARTNDLVRRADGERQLEELQRLADALVPLDLHLEWNSKVRNVIDQEENIHVFYGVMSQDQFWARSALKTSNLTLFPLSRGVLYGFWVAHAALENSRLSVRIF